MTRSSSPRSSRRSVKSATRRKSSRPTTTTLIDESGKQRRSFLYSALYSFLVTIYWPYFWFHRSQQRVSGFFHWVWTSIRRIFRSIGIVRFVVKELLHPIFYVLRYRFFITTFLLLSSAGLLFGAGYVYDLIFKDLPIVTELTSRQPALTTKILDRNGKLLYQIFKDENRVLVSLDKVSPNMKYATIAIEDKDFYQHKGISVKGIIRAFTTNLKGEEVQGGSTITQQLVKNTLLTSERTFRRKVREILLSIVVESSYSKDQILELYFNQISYGGSVYGVEAAAQRFFGKPASKLTLAESALLAGLPAAPSIYSPFGAHPELAYDRQHEVLRRMAEDGYITAEQAEAAKAEQLHFRPDTNDIRAPHFVMYIRDLLAKEYGDDVLSRGGLEIKTTLDLDLQDETQKIVTDEVDKLKNLRIKNGAALITNPKTGEILSMIGSKNYFDVANDGQVNVTLRARQPGSSIKPLTYAIAFEEGKTPSSMVLDEPISYSFPGSPVYAPKNYDGRFHGNVSLRESLGSSYNIPAVKTLASIGVDTLIDKGQEMGISTWKDRRRFGLSLTLGSGEVYMTELAQVYGTFANNGETTTLNPLLEIKNRNGQIIYENLCAKYGQDCPSEQTLSPRTAYQITNVLMDNQARTPAFGPRSVLFIPNQEVAVKTGTTNNLRDNWSIGYTEDRLVAVWVGNNDNTPMSYVASGITGASPIWNKIFREMLDDDHPHRFPAPAGFVTIKICAKTGTLPCAGCPKIVDEIFPVGEEPKEACRPEQLNSSSPNSSPVSNFSPSPSPNLSRIQKKPVATPKPTPKPTPFYRQGKLLPGRTTR